MNHISGIDPHRCLLLLNRGIGLLATASNLRRLIKLICLQALRKAALAWPAGFFRTTTGLWELAKTIFAYFSGAQCVFSCLGGKMDRCIALALRRVFARLFKGTANVHDLTTTTIHTTKKLEKQIKKRIQTDDSHSTGLLGKWNAKLFYVNRKKCWLISNGLTKYNVILIDMNAKKLLDFEDIFKNTFHDQLVYDGLLMEFKDVENLIGEIVFKPTDNDRVTTGFQNQRIQDFEWWQEIYHSLAKMPIREMNGRMNATAIHVGQSKRMADYTTSVEEMKKVLYKI